MQVYPYRGRRFSVTDDELEQVRAAMADIEAPPRHGWAIGVNWNNTGYYATHTKWLFSSQFIAAETIPELIGLMRLYMADPTNALFEEVNAAFAVQPCIHLHRLWNETIRCETLVDLRQQPNGLCPKHQPQGD